jgi:RNA polymerase-interacting CarD/CdnL/TRCF family regulator
MFEIGATIVHTRYGAGTVVGERVIKLDDETRHYICIELSGERGTLMVQPDEVKPEEVRYTMDDMTLVREVFSRKPHDLSDQHRSRQPKLRAKLNSNDPGKIAQVLRDLMWRERTQSLTETDRHIMQQARRQLLQEFKVSDQGDEIDDVAARLDGIMNTALQKHLEAAAATAQAG